MLRQARLKPAHTDQFPTVDPSRWYTAAALAGMVKGTLIVREGAEATLPDRVLEPAYFEFRGGSRRRGSWSGLRTRRDDRQHAFALAQS